MGSPLAVGIHSEPKFYVLCVDLKGNKLHVAYITSMDHIQYAQWMKCEAIIINLSTYGATSNVQMSRCPENS